MPEIKSLGGQIVVVSFATPEHVDHFARHLGHPFKWLADPERRSYHAFDLGRASLRDIFTSQSIGYGIKQFMHGHLWRPQQRDLAQLGGDFVIAPGGELLFTHRSRTSDDRPPLRDLLAAMRSAAS